VNRTPRRTSAADGAGGVRRPVYQPAALDCGASNVRLGASVRRALSRTLGSRPVLAHSVTSTDGPRFGSSIRRSTVMALGFARARRPRGRPRRASLRPGSPRRGKVVHSGQHPHVFLLRPTPSINLRRGGRSGPARRLGWPRRSRVKPLLHVSLDAQIVPRRRYGGGLGEGHRATRPSLDRRRCRIRAADVARGIISMRRKTGRRRSRPRFCAPEVPWAG